MESKMNPFPKVDVIEFDANQLKTIIGRAVICITPKGDLNPLARRVDQLIGGTLGRWVKSKAFKKVKSGQIHSFAWPSGLAVESLDVLILASRPKPVDVRKIGALLGKRKGSDPVTIFWTPSRWSEEFILGVILGNYKFTTYKSNNAKKHGDITVHVKSRKLVQERIESQLAVASGVMFTRDLVHEPANQLTTTEFARRISEMSKFRLDVKILDEAALEKIGMQMLLSVGQGSESPSKVALIRWKGGRQRTPPLALVGKGVVFDTGGISLKSSGGMEEMTMDMAGAGVVAGVMLALAKRKANANVIGVVGLVENMPSGKATRPGDVVTSLQGDTVEVINTDAEGRLVLGDLLSYVQDQYSPSAIIDLATLTGAIIVSLGHEHAGVFSNNDSFCRDFLNSAKREGEGAWRMPLGSGYDKLLNSSIADFKNIGGRNAGAITAAQFLQKFIKNKCPWIHLDIAGVAFTKTDSDFAPKGATGWGVMALNRLIQDRFEGE